MPEPSQPSPSHARLRVCIASQTFRPTIGGAELLLERLLPHLAARGVEATVVTRAYAGQPRRERIDGATVLRTRVPGRSPTASIAFVAGALAHVGRNRARIDLVQAFGALSDGTIALGATYLGVPGVVRILRTGYLGDFEQLATKPGGTLRARLLAERAWFIAQSGEAREEIIDRGVPRDRVFELPNGVDARVYRPATEAERHDLRRKLGFPQTPVGVFAGRLTHEKAVDVLVDALPGVPRLSLVIAGDGPERGRLEALATANGVADRIRFLGFVDGVHQVLRAADAFFLPSRAEGMSNALLEAMACGLACAATRVSGVPQLLAEGRGIIIDSSAPRAWRPVLAELAADGHERRRLGAAAAEYVARNLTLDRTADRLVSIYRAIAGLT